MDRSPSAVRLGDVRSNRQMQGTTNMTNGKTVWSDNTADGQREPWPNVAGTSCDVSTDDGSVIIPSDQKWH